MFKLTKHYFDNIDTQGNLVMAYVAELSIFGITLPYSSVITLNEQGELHERSLLKRTELSNQMGSFTLKQPELDVSGRWYGLSKALPEIELLKMEGKKDKEKIVSWHVHTPLAKAEWTQNNNTIKGLGYGETMSMNFEPWHFPIDEWYWGRFLSPTHSVVWLEWRGEHNVRFLYHDGMLQEEFEFLNDTIRYEFGTIVLRETRIIKDAPLMEMAQRFPIAKKLFKKDFLQTHEQKFISRATLTLHDGTPCEGFALYERVVWHI